MNKTDCDRLNLYSYPKKIIYNSAFIAEDPRTYETNPWEGGKLGWVTHTYHRCSDYTKNASAL